MAAQGCHTRSYIAVRKTLAFQVITLPILAVEQCVACYRVLSVELLAVWHYCSTTTLGLGREYFTAGGLDLRIENGRLKILREGKNRKFVPEVEHVTFSGRRARQIGQKVIYVTERCVLRLGTEGLEVFEIAPGIDLQRDVLEQTNTPLRVAKDLKVMEERLFRPEPMGLRFAP